MEENNYGIFYREIAHAEIKLKIMDMTDQEIEEMENEIKDFLTEGTGKMTTFPFSKLSTETQAQVIKYDNTRWITFVKPVCGDFVRFAIATFSEIDAMLAKGWLVINRMA